MKTNVGYSTLADAVEAGKETAKKAMEGIKEPKVAMLYSTVDYDIKNVIKGAKEVLGDIPVVGSTTSGAIIVPDGVIQSENGAVGMMVIEDADLIVGAAGRGKKSDKEDAREIGREIADLAQKNAGVDYAPSYYYMACSPKEEELYSKGIQDVIGDVPFFGGSAADNTVEGKWSIYCNEEVYPDGVAALFFYTEKPIQTVFTGAYEETKNVGIITKTDGNRSIIEIDNRPALDVYAEWIGEKVEDLTDDANLTLLRRSVTQPLGVKDMVGDLIAIRHPMNTNKDHVVNVGARVVENTAVIQMNTTVDGLIKSTGDTLKEVNSRIDKDGYKPAGYFLVHCGGRRLGVIGACDGGPDRIEEVHKQLVKASNGVPFITIFTFGEYGYNDHTRNTLGGLMLSFTGFEK